MGERLPPRARRVLRPDLGQRELRAWVGDARADSILPVINESLQVTESIARFQRRLRAISQPVLVAIGERPRWIADVPINEAWRIQYVQIHNPDSGSHIFTFQTGHAGPTLDDILLMKVPVPAATTQLIWPAAPHLLATAGDFEYRLASDTLELFGGEKMKIAGNSGQAIAGTAILSFWYELIPNRRNFGPGTPWVGVSTP